MQTGFISNFKSGTHLRKVPWIQKIWGWSYLFEDTYLVLANDEWRAFTRWAAQDNTMKLSSEVKKNSAVENSFLVTSMVSSA